MNPGLPSRAPDLDALPGFQNPPPGYGEVPFWWWSGDKLDAERLIAQVRELKKKGVSGVQVNYSHLDTPGWPTEQDGPLIFSREWWEVYGKVSEACASLGMGIGLSTYTLDWPRGAKNLFFDLFYSRPELNAVKLEGASVKRLRQGECLAVPWATDQWALRAYPVRDGKIAHGGIDLSPPAKEGSLTWTAPEGEWEIWSFRAVRVPGSLNPLLQGSGDSVIRGFFQPFQDHNPGKSAAGLNYFFNDELHIGAGKHAWNADFAAEFRKRKGYELAEWLPALFIEFGDVTPKLRMDYADVRMALMEERYFKPIHAWHEARGLIFACDSGGRGLDPAEFGDYFRVTRWYTAPGHDTPGGKADLIKGKVSSSIANLYGRPRVWLEGYHSLGWGAAPERLMQATRENYLYGCTLFNLHGLYYSTHGSHWEWAPPCYHFRMPYWEHMGVFLGYFERLSYLLSQGHLVCDVAVVYPVAPYEADLDGKKASQTAFDLARKLMGAGINFEFIDNDSLARAKVEGNRLVVKEAGASYQALVLTDMEAVRWATLEKAAVFAEGGGIVMSVGAVPTISDRAGRGDALLSSLVAKTFRSERRYSKPEDAVKAISGAFIQDVRMTSNLTIGAGGADKTVRALHRKAGPREVYFVMDAEAGSTVEFHAKGAVELWDPWTGKARPLRVLDETATGTRVMLPLEAYEAQVVVFTPGKPHVNPPADDGRPWRAQSLPGDWTVSFIPTMDNTHGDFRLPVTAENQRIGLEARRFAWARETELLSKTAMLPSTDDTAWPTQLHGYGPQCWVLGPLPDATDHASLDAALAGLQVVDAAQPISIDGKEFHWKPYEFSWRMGKEGDLGHQGYHGLKRTVTDDFLCLGRPVEGLNETRYEAEPEGSLYYVFTRAIMVKEGMATLMASTAPPTDKSHTSPTLTPAALWLNGNRLPDLARDVSLKAGANALLARYDKAGRGHLVLRRKEAPLPTTRTPLSMRWYDDTGLIPYDLHRGAPAAEWFRFLTAPGTKALRLMAHGKAAAWLDGQPMVEMGPGHFAAEKTSLHAAVVAIRVEPEPGYTGGAIFPDPIAVETDGTGLMPLGDWSKLGILNNYSGGARYSTTVSLDALQATGPVELDLGGVSATAEVWVNGKSAGVRVAPPWSLDVSGLLKAGSNLIEVLVYNTLANHYQTIPSKYRGEPRSGLFGPVRLKSRAWNRGELLFETAAGPQAGPDEKRMPGSPREEA